MASAVKHTVQLKIDDCDPKLARMLQAIHKAHKQNIRFGFEANFSGNPNDPEDFKYYFNKVDIETVYKLLQEDK